MYIREARSNVLKGYYVLIRFMSPARAGSFNANFSPETLESFKSLCRDQSRQYTKVLERLAELYLGSQGGILDSSEDATLSQVQTSFSTNRWPKPSC